MLILYYCYLFVLLSYCINMCLHPINGYDILDRPIEIAKYQHELDNCDYFEQNDPIDANHGDLLVIQLNVQGLFNKMSNLHNLVNNICCSKRVDIILLCETWQNKNSPTISLPSYNCCDMGQNDTIGKIELNPSFILSSDNTNYKNDIRLFHQLFDELRVNGDCHLHLQAL